MTETYAEFIKNGLTLASEIAISHAQHLDNIEVKDGDNNQVLTSADIAIAKFLIAEVSKTYPSHNIIDEEAGVIDNGSNLTWVIDPIDGTSNYAAGLPTYCIMLGLLEGGKPVAGGIALPATREILIAEVGKGTHLGDKRLFVTKETELKNVLVSYGIDGHPENAEITTEELSVLAMILPAIRNLRANNSCYDVALVARGQYGAWINRYTKIWDNVAAQVVMEEAGGVYTDFFGQPIDYSNPLEKANENFTLCTAAPELHRQLQSIIHST